MSLFNRLYEKIIPIVQKESDARALAYVLTEAFQTRQPDVATKQDINELKHDLKSLMHELNNSTVKRCMGGMIALWCFSVTALLFVVSTISVN